MRVVTIRRGVEADAAALSVFAERTFAEAFGAQNTPEDLRAHAASHYTEELQRRELANAAYVTLLAESGEAFVGYAQLRRVTVPDCVAEPTAIEILRFYVDRPAHGTGLATRLMNAAKDAAAELGARAVWLGVWEKNPRAIAFYTKAGFRAVGKQQYVVGSDVQHDRVMVATVAR